MRRILRLQRFLALAGDSHTGAGLAELAVEAGYADQQHLARDARAIARATPSDLVAQRRTRQPAVSDPSTRAATGGDMMSPMGEPSHEEETRSWPD